MNIHIGGRYMISLQRRNGHPVITGAQITDIDNAVPVQIFIRSNALNINKKGLSRHKHPVRIHDLQAQIPLYTCCN